MKEKVKCKKCGLLIDKDCETCPYCGYKQNDGSDIPTINEEKVDPLNPNTKIFNTEKLHFFDFASRELSIKTWKSITFFLVGFFGLNLIATIISLFTSIFGQYYFLSTSASSAAINFSCYLTIFACIFIILGNNFYDYIKEFKGAKTWIYGLSFGFLLIIASSAVSSFFGLFQETSSSNQNEQAIDSVTTLYPVLSLLIFGIVGPLCEEFTYRVGLFTALKKRNRVAAYLITAFLFGFIHFTVNSDNLLNEFLNLPSYIVAGLLLCYFYDYKGVGVSSIAHITNNFVALLIQIVYSYF